MNKPLTYIDLFAGCGGLSLGFHSAGWQGLFAIEKTEDAFKTLNYNLIQGKNHFAWPSWLPQKNLDIDFVLRSFKDELIALRRKVDLVAGGPPCQGFSFAGRRREDDIRNNLIKSYLKFILYVQPRIILFENVKGFTLKFEKNKSKGIAYSQYVVGVLEKLGYQVKGQMIDFSDFGVPQKRTRFILVAFRKDFAKTIGLSPTDFFQNLLSSKKDFCKAKNIPQYPTLGNAISDLLKSNGIANCPDRKFFVAGKYSRPTSKYQKFLKGNVNRIIPDSHSFANHSDETEKKFKLYLKYKCSNKNLRKDIRRKYDIKKHVIIPLSKELPSPTITTLPDDYIHYCEPRILTVREYARIQSFPDWYEFKGKYTTGGKLRKKQTPRYTQIGNAIPPIFGEQAAIVLKNLLRSQAEKNPSEV